MSQMLGPDRNRLAQTSQPTVDPRALHATLPRASRLKPAASTALGLIRLANARLEAALGVMVRRHEILQHEAQHRMANSVQIVASMLQQSAHDATTPEARRELQIAHERVMAITTLERLLSDTAKGQVSLAAYLRSVTHGLGQSLLPPDGSVSIRTRCAEVSTDAATATSLGLVVTELVINAVKHAFPAGLAGAITVTFAQADVDPDTGWELTVSDDGAGFPALGHSGLGSRIIPALAAQLDATLSQRATEHGTCIILRHR